MEEVTFLEGGLEERDSH